MKRVAIMMILLSLSACGHKNVGSDWDCPAIKGSPCISISKADDQALNKITPQAEPTISTGIKRTVWLNGYVDAAGNQLAPQIVTYSE